MQGRPIVPPWVPAAVRAEIDVAELATEAPGVREECVRLEALLGANLAAYRRGARSGAGGLCSRYRAMALGPDHLSALACAERKFPEVVFVAYRKPLTSRARRWPGW
jgi:hypothetical protein